MEFGDGAPVAHGAALGRGGGEFATADAVGEIEIEVQAVGGDGVRGVGHRQRQGWRLEEEDDVGVLGRVGVSGDNGVEFGGGAEEGREGELSGEGGGDVGFGGEDDVAGLDVGLDVAAAGGFAEADELLHREAGAAADVDSAQESEVGGGHDQG